MSQFLFGHHKAGPFIGLMAAAIFVAAASLAQAQGQYNWNVAPPATGDWTNSANWTSNPWTIGGDPGMVIENGGTANVVTGDVATDLTGNGYTYIGTPNGNGWVNMTGGQFAIGTQLLGYATSGVGGSGVFTQSAGVNTADSFIELGPLNGGYGEYSMSGGSINGGSNGIMIGANDYSTTVAANNPCGTGVFTQTGGSVGSFGTAGVNNAIGLVMAGKMNGTFKTGAVNPNTAVATYNFGAASGVGSPLLVGGIEVVGVTGTATFNQTCGTNALVGGGILSLLDTTHDTVDAGLIVGFYGGYQQNPEKLWRRRRLLQP